MRQPAWGAFLLSLLLPAGLSAQEPVPSYAVATETLTGRIASITGKYTLTLDDVRGFTDSVTMHAGTTIAPEGVSLAPGQSVRVTGHADGRTFDADAIDSDGIEPGATGDDGGADAYGPGDPAPGYALVTTVVVPVYVTGVPFLPAPCACPGGPRPRPHPPRPPIPPPVTRAPPHAPGHPRRH